jgi:hypothetical protein
MENSNLEHSYAHGTKLAFSAPIIEFKSDLVLKDEKVAMGIDSSQGNARFLNTDVITFSEAGIQRLIKQNIPFVVFSNLLGVEPAGSSKLTGIIEWREAGESLGTHVVNGVEVPTINEKTGGTTYTKSHWAIIWDSQALDLSDGLLDEIQTTLQRASDRAMDKITDARIAKSSSASAKRRALKEALANQKLAVAEPKVEPKAKGKAKGKAADENPL